MSLPTTMNFQGVMKTPAGPVNVYREIFATMSGVVFVTRDTRPTFQFLPMDIEDLEWFEAVLEVNEIAPGLTGL